MSGFQGIIKKGGSSEGGKGIPGGGGNSGGGGSHNEFRKNFALIEKGMSKKEVIELLGTPDDIKTGLALLFYPQSDEIWKYIREEEGYKVFYSVNFLKEKGKNKKRTVFYL